MSSSALSTLCGIEGCRRLTPHSGAHSRTPSGAWSFMKEKDQKKLIKAGFATQRGGAKGAYQNHVSRESKVIIPYEKRSEVGDLEKFQDGYVFSLRPDHYFARVGVLRPEFEDKNQRV